MIERLIAYWRSSLADEDIMGDNSPDDTLDVHLDGIAPGGTLAVDVADQLRQRWAQILRDLAKDKTSAELAADDVEASVPVVLLAHGMSVRHSHGAAALETKSPVRHTMTIPAVLGKDGRLQPSPDSTPWIGREFLEPTGSGDDAVPVVGSLADFDQWLDLNPFRAADWAGLSDWCDGLWHSVAGGRAVDGFVEIPGLRVRAAKTTRDAASQIRRLYDSLLHAGQYPALLQRACLGCEPGGTAVSDRLAGLAAPAGSMAAAHGLARNQADAALAVTRLRDGELVAVNGPPGTGKTTLLQGIVATEVVVRALAGRDPAIIVGCSTNNQAVININKAMNEVLQKNRTGDHRAWARRWVGDAETYGLFMPSQGALEDARKRGFRTATSVRGEWKGFPERETDLEYISQAELSWRRGFQDTYARALQGLDVAVEDIRSDLRALLSRMASISAAAGSWVRAEEWWKRESAGSGMEPEAFVEAQLAAFTVSEAAARSRIEAHKQDKRAAEADWAVEMKALEDAVVSADSGIKAAFGRFDEVASACLRVRAAAVAQGLPELMAEVLPIFRSHAAARQHARMAMAVMDVEGSVFRKVIHIQDRAAWLQLVDATMAEMQEVVDGASQVAQNAGVKVVSAKAIHGRKAAEFDAAIVSAQAVHAQALSLAVTRMDELGRKLGELRLARSTVSEAYEALRQEAEGLVTGSGGNALDPARADWVYELGRILDVTVRHEMFQKAMRYWEGRWILEAQKLGGKMSSAKGRQALVTRLRRWCMLTPCIVSTLHSLPRHVRFTSFAGQAADGAKRFASDFLLEGIDLLILDESGQVAPQVGMAAFSLAKRAVVVGDVHQLEPVARIPAGTDHANCVRAGLGDRWVDGHPTMPHILSESADRSFGSVMRVVQAATSFTSPGVGAERGMFLAEHRRCDSDIIGYCNDLVYSGRLVPCARPGPKAPGMRAWGWAHVRGTCRKGSGGSRVNEAEALAVADWIATRALGEGGWLDHYKGVNATDYPNLRAIVGVVTPFKAQASRIKQALVARDRRLSDLIVGTVDALQGAEYPIVVMSPTYSREDDSSGSLFMIDAKPNRLNVAVSRAKDSFVMIGDMRCFKNDGRKVPSSVMARYLFSSPDNEIVDIDLSPALPRAARVDAERISTLEGHQAALADAIRGVRAGERLVLVSPYISLRAVQADMLPELCKAAIQRGASIHAIVDSSELAREPTATGKGERQAGEALANAGVKVHGLKDIHNKTIVLGERQIVEGSFNWFSAVRDRALRGVRHETSWRISGKEAEPMIRKAVQEMVDLGVEL